MTDDLQLHLDNGTQVVVPNSLDCITTYVILEQERWFEKEYGFLPRLLQPGMVAVDIGANFGVYSLAMARAVGPAGYVFAYEPTSDTRARLERSKTVNAADNLIVLGSALSDAEREGRIVFGPSSELNRLADGTGGDGEAVHLTSLDIESSRHGWGAVDFVKLDAEGEELRIIAGGQSLFRDGSPVVMFEIKSTEGADMSIAQAFRGMGYDIYRLLPDEIHLVPLADNTVDSFELNLFAVRPLTAKTLAMRGLLVFDGEAGEAADGDWAGFVKSGGVDRHFPAAFRELPEGRYGAALAAYAAWRNADLPISARYAALRRASTEIVAALKEHADLARMLSASRIAYDIGQRTIGNRRTHAILKALDAAAAVPEGPFLPVSERHERLAGEPGLWLLSGCVEAFERFSKFSSRYGPAMPQLDRICGTALSSHELERRRVLSGILRGRKVAAHRDLTRSAPDHRNAAAWAQLIG